MTLQPKPPSATFLHMFDEIVCLKLEGEWCYVESGAPALQSLPERFAYEAKPSWQRAHFTCTAFLAGQVGI